MTWTIELAWLVHEEAHEMKVLAYRTAYEEGVVSHWQVVPEVLVNTDEWNRATKG